MYTRTYSTKYLQLILINPMCRGRVNPENVVKEGGAGEGGEVKSYPILSHLSRGVGTRVCARDEIFLSGVILSILSHLRWFEQSRRLSNEDEFLILSYPILSHLRFSGATVGRVEWS
jgi:hypothetical protein